MSKPTISKQLERNESHLPWVRFVRKQVASSRNISAGPAICVRERDGRGKVTIELFGNGEEAASFARLLFLAGG